MLENSSLLTTLASVNATFIASMVAISFLRKTYFNQKIDDIKLDIKKNIKKLDTESTYSKEIKEKDFESLFTPISKNIFKNNHEAISESEYISLLSKLNEIAFFLGSYEPIGPYLRNLNKENTKKSLEQVRNLIIAINICEGKLSRHFDQSKYKTTLKKLEQIKEELIKILINKKELETLEAHLNNSNPRAIWFLILFELFVGVSIPLISLKTLPPKIDLYFASFTTVNFDIVLTLASLFPYFYIIGTELKKKRHTDDTPST